MSRSRLESVYRLFTALASTSFFDPETGLGGKLLYAGELSDQSSDLLYAANIAGAASLTTSANPAAQRLAIREGVVDFLVTSLEEALRILKNEIRKRQPVSVAVALDPDHLAAQMVERGVLPDLLPPGDLAQLESYRTFLAQGARPIISPEDDPENFITWSVDRHFARWLPRLDTCAQTVIPAYDHARQRWLRLAPRYLGRIAQREHGVTLTSKERMRFEAEIQRRAAELTGEEPIRVRLSGS